MQKIIVVAFHMGRVGSSALMGLLNLSGINVGREESLSGASPMNPKGFFEIKKQEQFMRKVFNDYYPGVVEPPTFEYLNQLGEKYSFDYLALLYKEFNNNFPISIKSQRTLTVPFFHFLKPKFQIKLVLLKRNKEDQVRSIMRVWKKYGDHNKKKLSFEYIVDWVNRWEKFAKHNIDRYGFEYFNLDFEELLNNAEQTVEKLFGFIEEPPPLINETTLWLDKKLVNRKELL